MRSGWRRIIGGQRDGDSGRNSLLARGQSRLCATLWSAGLLVRGPMGEIDDGGWRMLDLSITIWSAGR